MTVHVIIKACSMIYKTRSTNSRDHISSQTKLCGINFRKLLHNIQQIVNLMYRCTYIRLLNCNKKDILLTIQQNFLLPDSVRYVFNAISLVSNCRHTVLLNRFQFLHLLTIATMLFLQGINDTRHLQIHKKTQTDCNF